MSESEESVWGGRKEKKVKILPFVDSNFYFGHKIQLPTVIERRKRKKKNQSSAEQSRDRACFSFTSATRSEVNLRCAVIVI